MVTIRKFCSNNVQEILPLNAMQSGMLIYYLKNQKSNVYFETFVFDIHSHIVQELFVKAWNLVIANNEVLRSQFVWENIDCPIQIIWKQHEGNILIYNSLNNEGEIKFEDIDLRVSLYEIPFKIVLYQYDENKYRFVMSSHHILFDGWSTGIILEEFLTVYYALENNKQVEFKKKSKYKDYLKRLNKRDKTGEELFWKEYFKEFDFETVKYFYRKKQCSQKSVSVNKKIIVENAESIEKFVAQNKITFASYIYTAWAIALSKHSGEEDLSFGTTVSGRTLEVNNIENMVGLFINTIPFRKKIDVNDSILNSLHKTCKSLVERKDFEITPLNDIKKYCNCKHDLFDSLVVIENYPLAVEDIILKNNIMISAVPMVIRSEYDVIVNMDTNKGINITVVYNEEKILLDSILEISTFYKHVLEEMMDPYRGKIKDLSIYSESSSKGLSYEQVEFDF